METAEPAETAESGPDAFETLAACVEGLTLTEYAVLARRMWAAQAAAVVSEAEEITATTI